MRQDLEDLQMWMNNEDECGDYDFEDYGDDDFEEDDENPVNIVKSVWRWDHPACCKYPSGSSGRWFALG